MKSLLILFSSLLLLTNLLGQKITSTNPDGLTIEYYGVNSQESIERTKIMRDAQSEITLADNGEEIIFVDYGIYVQFSDGSGKRLLITGFESVSYPTWSLDGSKIAFAVKGTDPKTVDLWVANSDGSDLTLIFTFNQGYYSSHISSISWNYSSEYIMFSIWYNDAQLNDYYVIATIHYTGGNLSLGTGFDHTYCQYEPEDGSDRYAYTSSGIPGYFNSELRVSNLGGTYTDVWFQHTGVVSGLTHVCWNNTNSIYTIVRFWSQYPNKEVMIRVDKSGGNYTFTPLLFSGINNSLWSPTVSPDRTYMYISELTSSSSLMYLVTFDQNGNVISIQSKGTGQYPNWRQALPLPGQVTLLSPPNNATGVSITPTLTWQAVPSATAYRVHVYTLSGTLVFSIDDLTSTQIQIGPLNYESTYIWLVEAKNAFGYGPPSTPFKFTTEEAPTLPNAPSNLNASSLNSASIELSWQDNSNNEDGFLIQRKITVGGTFGDLTTVGANVTTYTDLGLLTNTVYCYRVRAFNVAGNSIFCAEDCAITEPNAVEYEFNGIPSNFELFNNYPNPFNSSTLIYYAIPSICYVELTIYDVLGKQMEILVASTVEAGYHSIEFNATNYNSGIYFYTIRAGDFIKTQKMILLK